MMANSFGKLHSQPSSSTSHVPLNVVLLPAQHPGLVQPESDSPECFAPKSLLL